MIPKSIAWLKIIAATAVGGGAEAIVTLYQHGFDTAQIDYHRMGQTAGMGALIAICHLFLPPPIGDTKK